MMNYSFELFLAPIVIFAFVTCACLLLGLIIHLIYRTHKKWKMKKSPETYKLILILVSTIVGISSFELALISTIMIVFQVYLLDSFVVGDQHLISYNFFMLTHDALEYLIAVFDSLGHLSMLFVFIFRFKYTFSNQIFNQSQIFIRFLYVMLAVLFIISLIIIFYIFPSRTHSKNDILIWEITWELCVESTVLFILALFVYNLYQLLKLSVISHLKNGDKHDLLAEITKLSLEQSKSSRDKSSRSKGSSKKNKNVMTIDGTTVSPYPPSRTGNINYNLSVQKSVKSPGDRTPETDDYISEPELADHEENDMPSKNEPTPTPSPDPKNTCTPTPSPDPRMSNRSGASGVSSGGSGGSNQAVEVLVVMNKMTMLVIIAAVASFLTIMGNGAIESVGDYNEKDVTSDEGLDHDVTWVMILPVFDMVVTSFMLYLQFNFTHRSYKKMCHCVDHIFLRCMLSIITYCLTREPETEKTTSFIMDNNASNKQKQLQFMELHTKSSTLTATTKGTNGTSDITSEQIELEMYNEIP